MRYVSVCIENASWYFNPELSRGQLTTLSNNVARHFPDKLLLSMISEHQETEIFSGKYLLKSDGLIGWEAEGAVAQSQKSLLLPRMRLGQDRFTSAEILVAFPLKRPNALTLRQEIEIC